MYGWFDVFVEVSVVCDKSYSDHVSLGDKKGWAAPVGCNVEWYNDFFCSSLVLPSPHPLHNKKVLLWLLLLFLGIALGFKLMPIWTPPLSLVEDSICRLKFCRLLM